MTRLFQTLTVAFGLLIATAAFAHEVRPAYLEIDQTGIAAYKVIWKQPTMGDVAIHLVPHLSNGWLEQRPADQYAAAGFLVRTWLVKQQKPDQLDGRTITIEGLEDTMTDVYVRIRLLHDQHLDAIMRSESPRFRISLTDGNTLATPVFLLLGVEHILTGPDHLLFVLALLLIVRDLWMLLKTISAFTLAHSITLAAATLGGLALPIPLLNALVALSILFIAPEIIRAQHGGTSLTIRRPWIVAFAFGLLHGMGFASGLMALGLDKSALLGALVLFNIGVELGQLAFIVLVLGLVRSFRLMEIRWPRAVAMTPAYAVGIMGASWTAQYGAVWLGVAS
jgi:hypothetical protein